MSLQAQLADMGSGISQYWLSACLPLPPMAQLCGLKSPAIACLSGILSQRKMVKAANETNMWSWVYHVLNWLEALKPTHPKASQPSIFGGSNPLTEYDGLCQTSQHITHCRGAD